MKKSDSHITLDNFWPYQAVVLADQISRHTLSVVKREANINLSQWRVLAAVAEKPGRTAADVTAITPMDKTIVSRAVSTLISSGLITKLSDTSDKRRSSLTATAEGLDIYQKIAKRLNRALMQDVTGDYSPIEFSNMLQTFSEKLRRLTDE